ncbi:hypothetical protein [Arthrobacter psychrolactophilus]
MPEGSVYAAGSWPADAASGATTVVTLLSADSKVLSEKLQAAGDKRNARASFTIDIAGQSIDTTLKPLSVDTAADAENAMLISQLLPGDITNNTVTVEALQGSLLISVVQVGGDAQGSAAPELAQVVDQVPGRLLDKAAHPFQIVNSILPPDAFSLCPWQDGNRYRCRYLGTTLRRMHHGFTGTKERLR